jgi:hypothetical protein
MKSSDLIFCFVFVSCFVVVVVVVVRRCSL